MTFAPVVGRFQRRVVFNIVASLGVGTALAWGWWYKVHVPTFTKWRSHEAVAKRRVDAENAAYFSSLKEETVVEEQEVVVVAAVEETADETSKSH